MPVRYYAPADRLKKKAPRTLRRRGRWVIQPKPDSMRYALKVPTALPACPLLCPLRGTPEVEALSGQQDSRRIGQAWGPGPELRQAFAFTFGPAPDLLTPRLPSA